MAFLLEIPYEVADTCDDYIITEINFTAYVAFVTNAVLALLPQQRGSIFHHLYSSGKRSCMT